MQVELAVVPPDQHLEHRLALGHALLQALGEEADDLLGDRGQRVDPVGAVGRGVVGEGAELTADAGEDAGAVLVDQRLVEPAEPHAAGQVADHREAQLGGPDQPVEHLADRPGERLRRGRLADPALQQARDQVHVGRRTPLGQEDAEDRLLQLGRAVELGDAVPREHGGQPVAELLVQPVPLDVEALQVGVEVLARAVHAELGVLLLAAGPVAAQLGEVGEQVEQVDLAADHVVASGAGLLAGGEVAGQGGRLGVRVAVEAEQDRAQGVEPAGGPLVGGPVGARAPAARGRGRTARRPRRRRRPRRPARCAAAARRSRPGCRSSPAARAPARRTARAGRSPSSWTPAPAPRRRRRPRRRPRSGWPRPARARGTGACRPRRG